MKSVVVFVLLFFAFEPVMSSHRSLAMFNAVAEPTCIAAIVKRVLVSIDSNQEHSFLLPQSSNACSNVLGMFDNVSTNMKASAGGVASFLEYPEGGDAIPYQQPQPMAQAFISLFVKGDPSSASTLCYFISQVEFLASWPLIGAVVFNFVLDVSGSNWPRSHYKLATKAVAAQALYLLSTLACGITEEARSSIPEDAKCIMHRRHMVNVLVLLMLSTIAVISKPLPVRFFKPEDLTVDVPATPIAVAKRVEPRPAEEADAGKNSIESNPESNPESDPESDPEADDDDDDNEKENNPDYYKEKTGLTFDNDETGNNSQHDQSNKKESGKKKIPNISSLIQQFKKKHVEQPEHEPVGTTLMQRLSFQRHALSLIIGVVVAVISVQFVC
eukprot:c15465_g1_i1.p1 GENE.c15465_g1_i1~~c15465_g1_i1.p1  ORF type:complete len:400 (-),score=105.90 c15465_g1_i1:107-1264(-)